MGVGRGGFGGLCFCGLWYVEYFATVQDSINSSGVSLCALGDDISLRQVSCNCMSFKSMPLKSFPVMVVYRTHLISSPPPPLACS